MAFCATKLGTFGVEISDLDLSRDIDAEDRDALYSLWLAEGLLTFRGTDRTPREQVKLAECFGELQTHPIERIRLKDDPLLIRLGTEGDTVPVHRVNGEIKRGFIYWHSDLSYVPAINKGSLLRIVERPPQGGYTKWADTASAYDDLDSATQARLGELKAIHNAQSTPTRAWGMPQLNIEIVVSETYPAPPPSEQKLPTVSQPLVITHGETGRKSLMLSPLSFIRMEGLDRGEGDALFEEIVRHALSPKYLYTHSWADADMVLWDNRRTMHFATGYPPESRRSAVRATLSETQLTGKWAA